MSYLDRYKSTTAADRPPPPPTPSTNATPPPTPQYGDRRVARAADAARIRAHNRVMKRRIAATKPQIVHRHSEIVVVARREARARQIDARERRRADLQRSERASRRQRRSASPVRAARRLRPGTAAARVALALLDLCGHQISGAPRHRRDVISVISTQFWTKASSAELIDRASTPYLVVRPPNLGAASAAADRLKVQ